MTRVVLSLAFACLFAVACTAASAEAQEKPATPEAAKAEKETKYLASQIFTYGPNPIIATMGEGTHPQPAGFPDKATLRDYIEDIKGRIGAVGDQHTRLAVILGHLSFQKELPAWMQKTDDKDKAAALMQEMQEQLKAKNFEEVEKTADSILKLMGVSAQSAVQDTPKTEASPLMERLPLKIHEIQEQLPAWIQNGGDKEKASSLMQKMGQHLEAKNFEEADKTADSILKMMGVSEKAPAQDITEEVREKLAHNIGCSFLLFRTKVLGELKVSREQKERLDQHFHTLLPEAMQVLQKSNGGREKYNQKAHEETAAALKKILDEGQRTRLHQLELQKDMLFGPAWNMKELQITDAQRKQFMAPIQETQQKTQALMAEIHKGASPDVIRPKAFQLRLDLEVQLEALLTDAQKKQWKEMLGEPVEPGVLYGGL